MIRQNKTETRIIHSHPDTNKLYQNQQVKKCTLSLTSPASSFRICSRFAICECKLLFHCLENQDGKPSTYSCLIYLCNQSLQHFFIFHLCNLFSKLFRSDKYLTTYARDAMGTETRTGNLNCPFLPVRVL